MFTFCDVLHETLCGGRDIFWNYTFRDIYCVVKIYTSSVLDYSQQLGKKSISMYLHVFANLLTGLSVLNKSPVY